MKNKVYYKTPYPSANVDVEASRINGTSIKNHQNVASSLISPSSKLQEQFLEISLLFLQISQKKKKKNLLPMRFRNRNVWRQIEVKDPF